MNDKVDLVVWALDPVAILDHADECRGSDEQGKRPLNKQLETGVARPFGFHLQVLLWMAMIVLGYKLFQCVLEKRGNILLNGSYVDLVKYNLLMRLLVRCKLTLNVKFWSACNEYS
jgi:hypothetical protein